MTLLRGSSNGLTQQRTDRAFRRSVLKNVLQSPGHVFRVVENSNGARPTMQ
jgi:hypothetical protein